MIDDGDVLGLVSIGDLVNSIISDREFVIEQLEHYIHGLIQAASRKAKMRILSIFNDPPYGTERAYNALRLASSLIKNDASCQVILFLLADAVMVAKSGQRTPEGFYNLERMLKRVAAGKGRILACGTCMDARGLTESELMEGAQRSTMDELANETISADKVIVW